MQAAEANGSINAYVRLEGYLTVCPYVGSMSTTDDMRGTYTPEEQSYS